MSTDIRQVTQFLCFDNRYQPDLEHPWNPDGRKFRFAYPQSGTRRGSKAFAQGQLELFQQDHATQFRLMVHISHRHKHRFHRDEASQVCAHATSSFKAARNDGNSLFLGLPAACQSHEREQLMAMMNLELGISIQPALPDRGFLPILGIVAYGEEHNREETAHFLRSLFVHRSTPLRIIVIGDAIGLATLFEVMQQKLPELAQFSGADVLRLWNMDTNERCLELFEYIHPATKQRHPRLFVKLFSHELFPHVPRIIFLDNDLIVVDDIRNLWLEFENFDDKQLVSMTIDQSDRWYFRFQDPTDDMFSAGWVGTANRCGVNGGVQLWHNENVKKHDAWTYFIISLTHIGAARSQTDLSLFGILQEQDLLNFAIIQKPEIWKPMDCVWNYLPKTVFGAYGGHVTDIANGTMGTFIDRCVHANQSELFGCSCGRRVRIVHFVGATKHSNKQAAMLFQFWGHAPLDQLRAIASQNLHTSDDSGARQGAVRLSPPDHLAADDNYCFYWARCPNEVPWGRQGAHTW